MGAEVVVGDRAVQRNGRVSTPCLHSPPSIQPSTGAAGPPASPAPWCFAVRPTADHR
jgi:hypothetical protein